MNLEKIVERILTKALSGEDSTPQMPDKVGKNCIIRSYGAGVFVGNLTHRDGDKAILDNCRRLWYWKGASSLSQIAMEGVKLPAQCKFSVITNGHEILGVIEIIPTTTKAENSIYEVAEWKVE